VSELETQRTEKQREKENMILGMQFEQNKQTASKKTGVKFLFFCVSVFPRIVGGFAPGFSTFAVHVRKINSI
jgi:hypothetical protein